VEQQHERHSFVLPLLKVIDRVGDDGEAEEQVRDGEGEEPDRGRAFHPVHRLVDEDRREGYEVQHVAHQATPTDGYDHVIEEELL